MIGIIWNPRGGSWHCMILAWWKNVAELWHGLVGLQLLKDVCSDFTNMGCISFSVNQFAATCTCFSVTSELSLYSVNYRLPCVGRKQIFGDWWGCKQNWTGINGVEMKVAVMGGHGCNLFPCRALVVLRIWVRATMMLCLFITDLTCLHFYYWQEAAAGRN